jgi:glucose-6-phosphate isomerase
MSDKYPQTDFGISATTSKEILELLRKNNSNLKQTHLSTLVSDPQRFETFSCSIEGLLLDYSRVHFDQESVDLLMSLARDCEIEHHRSRLFGGESVNASEGRPAMHMAIRSGGLGKNLPHDEFARAEQSMERMFELAKELHEGFLPSDRKQEIRNIIHVGIGGSLLGTRLLCDAFEGGTGSVPNVYFLGSVDAHYRERLLPTLDARETIVILASKSFTTADTLMHGEQIRRWLETSLGQNSASQRMFAVTSNVEKATAMNIPASQVLYLPHWVGGRYSLWSPVSLAAAAVGGPEAFGLLLEGAAVMDRHFTETRLEENLPVLMGLLGVWHRSVCGYKSWGVIPYDHRLRLLPAHLQQLIMESNGKSVGQTGEALSHRTAPLVFGETGTDAQHSLFQSMHQGSEKVPLNLVGVIVPDHSDEDAHAELLANMLAQATALADGRSESKTRELMESEGLTVDDGMVSQRSFDGNRPSEILLLDNLGPENLGKLLALYEHKVFVESIIWGINAFDQWGVELGKSLAPDIRDILQGREKAGPAIAGLMNHIKSRSQM